MLIRSCLLLALLIAGAGELRAQAIRGRIVERDSGMPVSAAFVSLVDADGGPHAHTLTDSTGAFALTARRAGSYRLRAERVGYRTEQSDALTLERGQELSFRFEITAQAIRLDALRAESGRRGCSVADGGAVVQQLWDEVAKALRIVQWGEELQPLRFGMFAYQREISREGTHLISERRDRFEREGFSSFASREPEYLSARGYYEDDVNGGSLYGPSPEIILSPEFLREHCFRLADTRAGRLIGLAFEPLQDRKLTDIRGTLWVDPGNSELRTLTYEYTRLPRDLARFGAGGEIAYERLPAGAWVVSRWRIHSPLLAAQSRLLPGGIDRKLRHEGTRENGGFVTAIDGLPAAWSLASGGVRGVVLDSTTQQPVADVHVIVSGHPLHAFTDSAGRFHITEVPAGSHSLAAITPVIDSLHFPARLIRIDVSRDSTTELTMVTPSFEHVMKQACKLDDKPRPQTILFGSVRTSAGRPVAGIELTLRWLSFSGGQPKQVGVTLTTGTGGRYVACGIPVGTPVEVRYGRTVIASDIRLPRGIPLRQDLRFGAAR